MTAIIEHTPKTFNDILKIVEQFQSTREFAWYRGAGSSTHSLIPTIARRNPQLDANALIGLERSIANTFAQRSPPFVRADFASEWKTLFFMQHYGIPTRLLDWSESPFVGLYFALTSVKRDDTGNLSSDPALWLCDPIAWNKVALSHISYAGGILDENCEEIKSYSPSVDIDQRATSPIMIYGTHNSPRIVAQRGVFALFGKGTKGMENIFVDGKFPPKSLQKMGIIPLTYVRILCTKGHEKEPQPRDALFGS